MRGRGERLERILGERELERMLVTDLTNVRYLTGFTGSNGACVCGPGLRLFFTDFRYTERAVAEVEGWEAITVGGDWLGAIADALDVARLPAVEVHLSDVENRAGWRRESVFDGLVLAKISGKGPDGYREALELLARELGADA